jgi:hypothetical protein
MPHRKLPMIEVGYHLFVSGGTEEVGAVREVAPAGRPEIVVDIENAGDFIVPLSAIEAVIEGKVILTPSRLDRHLREAIRHAHEAELPPSLEGGPPDQG